MAYQQFRYTVNDTSALSDHRNNNFRAKLGVAVIVSMLENEDNNSFSNGC